MWLKSTDRTKIGREADRVQTNKAAHLLNVWKVYKVMKATAKNIQAVANEVNNTKTRSAWSKGVKAYALELLGQFEEWSKYSGQNGEELPTLDERTALNGASDWKAWAYGGCGLCYDAYIAERLCTPSELRKLGGGARVPAGAVTWCDVEARAAWQAWRMIAKAVRKLEA